MGLSNSRLESRPSRSRANRSPLLSSLLCGASSSRTSHQMEENCENVNEFRYPIAGLSSVSASSPITGFSGPTTEIVANSGNHFDNGIRPIGTSTASIYSPESNSVQVSDDFGRDESSRDSHHRLFRDQLSSDTVSVNVSANTNAVNGIGGSEQNGVSASDSRFPDQVSSQFNSFGSNRIEEEVVPSGLGILLSNRERSLSDGSVLHVDVLSISSNVLSSSSSERSSHEARRNGRRMFWDAFSRRSSSRRLLESPAFLFSMDGSEDVASRNGWVFGLTGDFLDDASGSESGYPRSGRIQYSSDRRQHSRVEAWERLRNSLDESSRWYTLCPSGHPDGSCLCNPLNAESSTRASISRIVMLAEALFEVLDEIHRQPTPLSLSMVSSPAPASVVDSFPLKSHTKIDKGKSSEDAEECYICLSEYEEGDKIRVLPCHHEYHMSCVDKWLQEIHGVCPLCRGDVRQGLTECSVSNSEIASA